MHFVDVFSPFNTNCTIILLIFKMKIRVLHMDNYLITLGMYLILMLFFKVYYAVSARD